MAIVIGERRRKSRAATKRRKKYKWEERLTESERAFVAQMNPLLVTLARRNTPYWLRRNEAAVDHSYMIGFKCLCRAAKKYDSTLSAPLTYTFEMLSREIRSMWRTRAMQVRFNLEMPSENMKTRSGEDLALSSAMPTDDRNVLDALADADHCRQAFRILDEYSPDLAAVMRLRYGFTHRTPNGNYKPRYRLAKEIAVIVKRSESWVRWAIQRSIELLRVCMKENG